MKRNSESGWVGLALGLVAAGSLMGCGGHSSLGEDEMQSKGGGAGATAGQGTSVTVGGSTQGGSPSAQVAGGGTGGSGEEIRCPCSRRPGANNSFRCPAGVGESATAVIGAEGGSIELMGQQGTGVLARVTIAPKQLSDEQELTLTETDTPPPADLNDYSPIYTLTGDVLPERITVRLPFGNLDGEIARDLTVYGASSADGPFVALPMIYVNAGFVEGYVDGYPAFLVAGARGAALESCP